MPRSSWTPRSTAPWSTVSVCASVLTDRRSSLVTPATTCIGFATAARVRLRSSLAIGRLLRLGDAARLLDSVRQRVNQKRVEGHLLLLRGGAYATTEVNGQSADDLDA